MSYNVAIVTPPVPADNAAAWAAVDGLIEQRGPRAAVLQELHDRLTARYSCLCAVPDDQIDDTVWSDGPLINNFGHRAAVLGMSHSRVEEVLPFLVETANALGLVVFDWATESVYRANRAMQPTAGHNPLPGLQTHSAPPPTPGRSGAERDSMANPPRPAGCATVFAPVWGLASAGGAAGFFGGVWVLPPEWWQIGVIAGVVGGALAGWLLGRRGRPIALPPDAVANDEGM